MSQRRSPALATTAVPDIATGLLPAQDSGPGARYCLDQAFVYRYSAPVRDLVHRLVVVPPTQHGDQRLLHASISVDDRCAALQWYTDVYGNRHCVVRLARVEQAVTMRVRVRVERNGSPRLLDADLLRSPDLLEPSTLTRPDAQLRRLSALHGGGPALEAADRLCALVYERVHYAFGTTSVRTTAAQALAGGTGVCQDQAHVLLALCRSARIPARYVSGHLIGQGGTHAWVEVLVAHGGGAHAVALDPCHGRRADRRYVTVAVGRDYLDVPPTSGWYEGAATGELSAERLLRTEPAA